MTKFGEAKTWLLAHVDHKGDDCLPWPFYRGTDGYGEVGWDGRKQPAHRIINILANGEPPDANRESAHECGNGHLGCVNPAHLSWKTHAENQADRPRHGRSQGSAHFKARLTENAVLAIREFSHTVTPKALADLFGVSRDSIYDIQLRRTWRHI